MAKEKIVKKQKTKKEIKDSIESVSNNNTKEALKDLYQRISELEDAIEQIDRRL